MKNVYNLTNYRSHLDFQRDIFDSICRLIYRYRHHYSSDKVVVLTIGTDKSMFDSFGPRVGSILARSDMPSNVIVRGELGDTLNALNLVEYVESHQDLLYDNLVIAVDSAISSWNQLGNVFIDNQPLYPGLGVNKNLPAVGDMRLVMSSCYTSRDGDGISYIDEERMMLLSKLTGEALCMALGGNLEKSDKQKSLSLF